MNKILLLVAMTLAFSSNRIQSATHLESPFDTIYVVKYLSDKECALSYTFDDGMREHYTLVYPKFEKLGFKGTFWINGFKVMEIDRGNPAESGRLTWAQLKEMAEHGQEISNHGWSHKNLTKISPAEALVEIESNDSIIGARLGERPVTYCYAYNSKSPDVVRMATRNRVGTRTEQFAVGGKSTPESLDKRIDTLLATHGWGVTMTHGITYGYDAFKSDTVFWNHLDKVKALEDRIWVAPFREVAAYIKEQDILRLKIVRYRFRTVVSPVLDLDPTLFHQPLTLVLRIKQPGTITARQDGKQLKVQVCPDKWLIDFDPNGKKIILETRTFKH